MKKILLLIVLTVIGLTANSQILQKGNTIIDAYYGFPNLNGSFLETDFTYATDMNIKTGSLGPMGIKAEHLLSDKVGLGLHGWYSDASVSWERGQDVKVNGTTYYDTVYYKVTSSRVDVLLMFNYHFVNTESVDSYFCVGAGYHSRTRTSETSGPTPIAVNDGVNYPFNFRLGVGLRYFFNENLGLNIEFGVFGPMLTGGICAKF